MKEWFSAQELIGLPELPTSDRRIRERAKRNNWLNRPKTIGKGLEYHISSLPEAAKNLLIARYVKESKAAQKGVKAATEVKPVADIHTRQASLMEYQALTLRQKKVVDAKFEVLHHLSESGISVQAFVERYNEQQTMLSADTKAIFPTMRKSTVYDWRETYNTLGLAGLAGKRGQHRRNTGTIDTREDLKDFIIGMVVEYPHIANTVLYKAIKTEFNGQKIPSLRTVERWVAKWKHDNKQVFCAITSPDEWKNNYMAAFGSGNEHITELNQLWEFDSTPADLMLQDGRHTIIGVIDVYTRRVKFVVSRTSNSKGVAQVIRQAIIDWGIPQIAKTDNGADYKSHYIQKVFRSLNIKQEFCPPFQAWKKPHIERVFRSFSHDILELLPGFIGHNVADRKQIESRKQFSDRLFKKDEVIDVSMSSDELQAFCDNWVNNEYHTRIHSETKQTPLDRLREWTGDLFHVDSERVLDILLSEPAGHRVITKKGISLDGGYYIHPELGAIVGDAVHVYYDDHDMGRIYVYDMNNQFVCIAEDPTITGVSRKEVAAKTKEVQREAVQEKRRQLKAAAKKISKRDMAQEILAHQAQQNLEQNTLAFPRPSQTHTSAGLEAAADALQAKDGIKQSGLSEELQAAVQQTQAQLTGQIIQPEFNRKPNLPTDPAEKYTFWCSLDQKVKAGLTIEEAYQRFYETFPRSAEFGGGKVLAELRQQTASK